MTRDHHERRRHFRLTPEATGARPGPLSVALKVLSAALSAGLIVLLFAAIIPTVTEFDGVVSVLESLSWAGVALLLAIALLIRLASAASYRALVPSLSLGRWIIAREASTAVSNVIPGPSGTAAQLVIVRSWGVGLERFTKVTVAVGVCMNALILIAPGLLFIVWTLLGQPASSGSGNVWVYGLIGVCVSAIAVVILVGAGRSVRFAAWLGRITQKCVNPLRRLFHKEPMTDFAERAVALRADMIEELSERGGRLVFWTVAGYALNAALTVLCMWACDIPWSVLPLSLGVLLYSVARLATIVAITPGGVGVVEIVFTAVFTAAVGNSYQDSVVAGVLTYRAFTYLLPIITGAFSYVIWRVMRRREIHHERVEAQTEA